MNHPVKQQLLEIISEINNGEDISNESKNTSRWYRSVQVGPRQEGQGLYEGDQGIISAFVLDKRCKTVELEITLLAAGFLVGSGGDSMRQIWKKTGASIRSFADVKTVGETTRTIRKFRLCGSHVQVLETIKIIVDAVDRYRELIGGDYSGQVVEPWQEIHGISFQYRPPPVGALPNSARTTRSRGKSYQNTQKTKKRGNVLIPQTSWGNVENMSTLESQESTDATTFTATTQDSGSLHNQFYPVPNACMPPSGSQPPPYPYPYWDMSHDPSRPYPHPPAGFMPFPPPLPYWDTGAEFSLSSITHDNVANDTVDNPSSSPSVEQPTTTSYGEGVEVGTGLPPPLERGSVPPPMPYPYPHPPVYGHGPYCAHCYHKCGNHTYCVGYPVYYGPWQM